MKGVYENFKKYPGLKIMYFVACGWLGSIQPFYSVYLHHFGTIKPSIIGIITCLIPVLSFVGSPIWTGLADKFKKQKQILILNCIITMIVLLLLIPINGNIVGIFIFISIYSISQAPIFPIIDTIVLIELGEKDSKIYGQQRLFAAASYGLNAFICGILIKYSINFIFILYSIWMILFLIYFIFTHTNLFKNKKNFKKLNDEKEIEMDEENQESEESENKREINNLPLPLDNNQVPIISNTKSIVLNNSDIEPQDILEIKLDCQVEEIEKEIKEELEKEIIGEKKLTTKIVLLNIVKDPHMIIFLFAIMIVGMTANIIANFLFLYLQDYKQASSTLLGSTMPFTVLMELPFFLISDKLLNFIGINKMIMIGHLAFIARLSLYNILNIESVSPWFVLPMELLHGVGFASTWTAGIELCNQMAPKGYEATYQGIFFGIYAGLGSALGSIIGGFLYEHKSPIFLFRFTAISTTFSLIVFSLTQLYFNKKQIKRINSNSLINNNDTN